MFMTTMMMLMTMLMTTAMMIMMLTTLMLMTTTMIMILLTMMMKVFNEKNKISSRIIIVKVLCSCILRRNLLNRYIKRNTEHIIE